MISRFNAGPADHRMNKGMIKRVLALILPFALSLSSCDKLPQTPPNESKKPIVSEGV